MAIVIQRNFLNFASRYPVCYFISRCINIEHCETRNSQLPGEELQSSVKSQNVTSTDEQSFLAEEYGHTPVMVREVLEALQPENGQIFLDMTFGAGGHSGHLLDAADLKLYCLDRDPVAYENAQKFAKTYDGSVTPLLGKFSEMKSVLQKVGVLPNTLDGILIDAGCSSMQMDNPKRGFSISKNGLLDMRMDGNRYPEQPTAADVLNSLDVPSLSKVFKVYGEEKHSRKLSQALFDARYMLKTINTTHELADLIQSTLCREQRLDKLQRPSHLATKVFQALRIFVNDELNELNYGMEMAHNFLKPGGKIAVLTFHSLEDRIVKRHILGINMDDPVTQTLRQKYNNAAVWYPHAVIEDVLAHKWTSLYKHVVKPSLGEIDFNPRSRSAKLRAAVKNSVE